GSNIKNFFPLRPVRSFAPEFLGKDRARQFNGRKRSLRSQRLEKPLTHSSRGWVKAFKDFFPLRLVRSFASEFPLFGLTIRGGLVPRSWSGHETVGNIHACGGTDQLKPFRQQAVPAQRTGKGQPGLGVLPAELRIPIQLLD